MKHVKRVLAMFLSIAMVFGLMSGVGAPRVSAVELTATDVTLTTVWNEKDYYLDELCIPVNTTDTYFIYDDIKWSPWSPRYTDDTFSKPTWSVSPAGVVEIAETRDDYMNMDSGVRLKAVGKGDATLTWRLDNITKTMPIHVVDVLATGITISPQTLDFQNVGETAQMTATVAPANAYQAVKYTSSDETVATVSATGLVTAVGTGSCTIRAISLGSNGTKSASVKASVILLEEASPVWLGNVEQYINLTVGGSGYAPFDSFFANASQTIFCKATDFTYASNDTSIATVDQNGVITAVGVGTTDIVMTPKNKTGAWKWDMNVTIEVTSNVSTTIPVASVSLTPNGAQTLKIGGYLNFSASVLPSNASNKLINWTSSNPSVVSLTGTQAYARAAGTATIRAAAASDPTKYAECVVTVENPTVLVSSVTVNPSTLSLKKGESSALTASVLPSNATNQSVTWSSSNTNVAMVDQNTGKVTAVGSGRTSIIATAKDGSGMAGSCTLDVTSPVTSLTFSSSTTDAYKDSTINLARLLTISPSDASNKTLEWSSSNPELATVTDEGVVTILKDSGSMQNATVSITAKSTDGTNISAGYTITIKPTKVTAIKLSASTLSLTKDESVKLSVASVSPDNATVQTVSWQSSAPSVATVDQNGNVTAVSGTAGQTAIITATAAGGDNVTDTCIVTVISADSKVAVEGVTLTPSAAQTIQDQTELTINAAVTPAAATTKGVNWSITSGNGTVVHMITSDAGQIKIKALAPGTAVIEASAIGDSTKKATITITVSAVEVSSISVSPTAKDMIVGDTYKVTATVLPANATDSTVTWQSSNPAVATVNHSGTVTAVSAGEATITATAGGKSATVKITVKEVVIEPIPIPVTSITVNPVAKSMAVGEVLQATATVLPSNAADKTVTWKSGNTAVATVNQNGLITAIAAGSTTITATAGGKSAAVTVTVSAPVVNPTPTPTPTPAPTPDPDPPATKAAQSITAKSSYTKVYGCKAFSLGAKTSGDGALSYKTSNKKIATVTSAGKVTIKGTGKVTITITAAETNAYKSAVKKVTITVKPKKATLSKLTSKKKSQVTVKWKKDTKATGYEITIATDKKFKKNKKTVLVKSYKTTSTTIKKLKSKKTYYVRIRSYKTISGKKVYGAYSKVLRIKVK